jgi:hypothetical protein
MTNARRIVTVVASVVLGALTVSAFAGSASARWDRNGNWHDDNRWEREQAREQAREDRDRDRYYNGYQYRPPPVVYGTPYNHGYYPPPVIYDNSPGFTIRIQ